MSVSASPSFEKRVLRLEQSVRLADKRRHLAIIACLLGQLFTTTASLVLLDAWATALDAALHDAGQAGDVAILSIMLGGAATIVSLVLLWRR